MCWGVGGGEGNARKFWGKCGKVIWGVGLG